MPQNGICPGVSFCIWLADNPAEVLKEHLSQLVERHLPTSVIHVRNKDKPWFDGQCSHAFGLKQEAHRQWTHDRSRIYWEEFFSCQVRANETYPEAKHQISDRNRYVLMNVHSPVVQNAECSKCRNSTILPRQGHNNHCLVSIFELISVESFYIKCMP